MHLALLPQSRVSLSREGEADAGSESFVEGRCAFPGRTRVRGTTLVGMLLCVQTLPSLAPAERDAATTSGQPNVEALRPCKLICLLYVCWCIHLSNLLG